MDCSFSSLLSFLSCFFHNTKWLVWRSITSLLRLSHIPNMKMVRDFPLNLGNAIQLSERENSRIEENNNE